MLASQKAKTPVALLAHAAKLRPNFFSPELPAIAEWSRCELFKVLVSQKIEHVFVGIGVRTSYRCRDRTVLVRHKAIMVRNFELKTVCLRTVKAQVVYRSVSGFMWF